MGRYLEALREGVISQDPTPEAPTRATKAPSVGFVGALPGGLEESHPPWVAGSAGMLTHLLPRFGGRSDTLLGEQGAATNSLPDHTYPEASPGMKTLCRRLRRARDWVDLSSICADAQVAWTHGEVSGDEAEAVCQMAGEASRRLPPESAAVNGIRAADVLLEARGPAEQCPACGQGTWWTDTLGYRKCAVCHPPPDREAP